MKLLEKYILDQIKILFLLNHLHIETVGILVWVFQIGFTSENSEYKLPSISRKLVQSALTKQI